MLYLGYKVKEIKTNQMTQYEIKFRQMFLECVMAVCYIIGSVLAFANMWLTKQINLGLWPT